MRIIKLMLLMILLTGYAFISNAKGYKASKIYMFGFAASFNDSTVYFTDIQEVNGYLKDDHSHFLANRNDYSFQFKNYLINAGKEQYPTTVAIYAEDRKALEKKYTILKAKYTTKSKVKFLVEDINAAQFHFTTVQPAAEIEAPTSH